MSRGATVAVDDSIRDGGGSLHPSRARYVAGCTVLSQSNEQVVVMMKTNDTHSLLFLAGVFLTCMCGLMLQIMETRMLSVIGQYNLAFFAIVALPCLA